MRKSYLDNLRWVTVVLVVIYHVLYMYNGEGIAGTLGNITNLDVQYYDAYMYLVYRFSSYREAASDILSLSTRARSSLRAERKSFWCHAR